MSDAWLQYLQANQERFVAEYLDLLRIPSISTAPEAAGEVRRAAEWTAQRLHSAGIEGGQVMETSGHPVVFGQWLHAAGRPTLLIYGHFDVQPVDPLHLWTHPPFEPYVEDGKVFARGASDMKGNLLLPVLACEALLRTTGSLPCNVKFLFEGEEEIGSPSLAPFIAAHKELLACDMAISADGSVGSAEQPEVLVGIRGLTGLQVNVRSAGVDMHSGMGGGLVPNAIHALVRLLDSMRDPAGRITVAGFYDEVRPLSAADKQHVAASPMNLAAMQEQTQVKALFGEPEFTPQERNVARPTLEVNGIWGGYAGAGVKTVIPCEAHAKITCRLVPDQEPAVIRRKLLAHIEQHAPAAVTVSVEALPGEGLPYLLPTEHPGLLALEQVLRQMSGRAPYRARFAATVPVLGMLKPLLGAETLTIGASIIDERFHAPDEFFRLANFARLQEVYCRFLLAV